MPVENEFAGGFELAQDVEIREKNAGLKTMHMWKNALNYVWNTKKLKSQLIECQKIMEAIIEAKGGRQNIEFW